MEALYHRKTGIWVRIEFCGDRYKIIDTCVAEKSRCVAGIVHIACNINIL
jgi:hypothetical protein